jgi:3-methyladenine DNA glycosylase/8-oxoguanine DNA glycosylase
MAQLPPMDLYGALLFQVTGQQLSVPATRRTLARIEALFDGHLPSPTELLGVDPAKLREAGLSWRKINTLRDLAERLSDGRLNPSVFDQPARRRAHGSAHRNSWDRSLDRAGCPHHAVQREGEAPPVVPRET